MARNTDGEKETHSGNSFVGWIIRLVLFAVVLGITSYLTPGFSIRGFWTFVIASVVITVLDYIVEAVMGVDASPFGKGFKGFVISVIIIYFTQYLIPNMSVSILGAILAALVIGVIDAIIPGRVM